MHLTVVLLEFLGPI